MRLSVPITALLTLLLAAPAMAQDDKVYAPPGNSGIEEYLEVVPGAGGDKPASGATGGGGEVADALGASNAKGLEALGEDGKAAAAAAAAGSPTNAKTARERARKQTSNDSKVTDSTSIAQTSGDEVTSVARALSGQGGGMGVVLPVLLGLTLAITLALGARRFLRRS